MPVTSPPVKNEITAVLAGIARLPYVASVRSPFAAGAAVQVSADHHIAYRLVRFDADGDALSDPAIRRVIDTAQQAARPGFAVQLGGAPVQKVEKPSSAPARRSGFSRPCSSCCWRPAVREPCTVVLSPGHQ